MGWVESAGKGDQRNVRKGEWVLDKGNGNMDLLEEFSQPGMWIANSAACLRMTAVFSWASLSIPVGPDGHYCLVGQGRGSADTAIQTVPLFTNKPKKTVGKWLKQSKRALHGQTQVS